MGTKTVYTNGEYEIQLNPSSSVGLRRPQSIKNNFQKISLSNLVF